MPRFRISPEIVFRAAALAPLVTAMACAAPPAEVGVARGRAFATAPITGADIAVWPVDPDTGARAPAPTARARTDALGSFAVALPDSRAVEIAISGGRTVSPRGTPIRLDPGDRVAVSVVGLRPREDRWRVMATPLTTLGTALAGARVRHPRKEVTYSDAVRTAHALVGGHFGDVAPDAAEPARRPDLEGPVLAESARYGLVLAGMAGLAADAGAEVHILDVAAAWARDLGGPDARFDAPGRRVAIGDCKDCRLGPDAPRRGLAAAVWRAARRRAGPDREVFAVAALAQALRTADHPELFAGPPPPP